MDIGKKIRQLRVDAHLQQKEVAQALDIRPSTLCDWEAGKCEPNPRHRKNIAEYFRISEAELFGANPQATLIVKIPVISWVHANKFYEIDDPFPIGVADEYIYSDIKGENVFALRVKHDCMTPEFHEGDVIIVKPNVHVTSGDYVIVADRQADSATFKQYKEYGKKKILHPLNPKFKDIELDNKKQYIVVGKVVAKQKKY